MSEETEHKKFEERSLEKRKINTHGSNSNMNFYVNSCEIRYVKLGVNIGFEQDGKKEFRRPVLVINRIGSLFFVVPLTTKIKSENKYYYQLISTYFDKPSIAILSQCRVIDKRRFMDKIGGISLDEMKNIQKKLKDIYLPTI